MDKKHNRSEEFTMEATAIKNNQNVRSDWEEISNWGRSLAEKKGLTIADSRKILAQVRKATCK